MTLVHSLSARPAPQLPAVATQDFIWGVNLTTTQASLRFYV